MALLPRKKIIPKLPPNPDGPGGVDPGTGSQTYRYVTPEASGYKAREAVAAGYNAAQSKALGYNSSDANAAGYTATGANAAGYDAQQRGVDAANETVENRMTGLLASSSDYMQRARHQGYESAQQRGLLNSSMAAGAAHAAAIDRALPIASQDANTYFTQGRANQDAVNQQRQYNAGNEQQVSQFNANSTNTARQYNAGNEQQNSQFNAANRTAASQWNAGNQTQNNQYNANSSNQAAAFNATNRQQNSQFNANSVNSANQFNAQQQNAMDAMGFDRDIQMQLKNLDAKLAVDAEELAQAGKLAAQNSVMAGQLVTQYNQGLADIMANPETSSEQKTRQAKLLFDQMRESLRLINSLGPNGKMKLPPPSAAPPAPPPPAGSGAPWRPPGPGGGIGRPGGF